MNFFSTIKATFWNPSFYRTAAEEHSHPFGYYFKMALLLSIIMTVGFCLFAGPNINATLSSLPDAVVAYYPDDLEVTLSDGAVTVNQPQPYMLPFPTQWQGDKAEKNPTNLVVFDTEKTFSVESFKGYDTAALVTHDALVIKSDSDIRVVPMSDFSCKGENNTPCNYTLTNDKLAAFLEHVKPLTVYVLPTLAVGALLVLIVIYALGLLALLITAAIGMLAIKLFAKVPTRLGFGTTYRMCVYAVTPALVIEAILSVVRTASGASVPYLHGFTFELILTILVIVLNLRAAYRNTNETSTTSPQQ